MAPPTQREYWNSKVGGDWVDEAERMDAILRAMTDDAFAALNLRPGERVLDIGCGGGATTLAAAQQVGEAGHAAGVDISRPLLDLARERAKAAGLAIDFIEADAGAAPIPGAPFDAAFSRFGVMFFEDPPAAFAKIRAALRAGGRFVAITWRTFPENQWTFAPFGALKPLFTAPPTPPDPNAPGPFALSDANRTRSILETAGWRDISITPWDGDVRIGADARDAAKFHLKIGPCARAIADQNLDPARAEQALIDFLRTHETPAGVSLAAACWIVRAVA